MLAKIRNLAVIEKEDSTIYGSSEYVEVKRTPQDYCSACEKHFQDIELCFFAPLDNSIICQSEKCVEPHQELELRLYIRNR